LKGTKLRRDNIFICVVKLRVESSQRRLEEKGQGLWTAWNSPKARKKCTSLGGSIAAAISVGGKDLDH
jgi:hypothetical protein